MACTSHTSLSQLGPFHRPVRRGSRATRDTARREGSLYNFLTEEEGEVGWAGGPKKSFSLSYPLCTLQVGSINTAASCKWESRERERRRVLPTPLFILLWVGR
eukprot:Sspe_Gene.5425::Locus_1789_Transcript_1_1_Confidence_1.000_Length_709::g.5425::m.5425